MLNFVHPIWTSSGSVPILVGKSYNRAKIILPDTIVMCKLLKMYEIA